MKDKILILSHEFPPYIFGGVGTFTKELAKYLAYNNYKVNIITGRAKTISIENEKNIKIIRTFFPDIPIRQIWYSLLNRNLIKKMAQKSDIIISHNNIISYIVRDIKTLEKPILMFFHGSPYSLSLSFRYGAIRSLTEFLYYSEYPLTTLANRSDIKYSTFPIYVAQHVRNELLQLFPDLRHKILQGEVVYPGVEIEKLTSYRSYKGKSSNYLTIAYIGRLYSMKGVEYALKTFKTILDMGIKNSRLWIFGDGPLKNYLQRRAKKLGLKEYVTFFGHIPREKLLELMSRYVNVLLFPSLYEGAPMVLAEANALGVPVVTFDLPWSREFVEDGVNGFKAPLFDIDKMAQYVIKSKELEPEKISEYAVKFDKNKNFKKVIYIIEKIK